MSLTESRAEGGRPAFFWSIRRIEATCGPSLGYLWLLGPYGCGWRWASILSMVFVLMPVSRATWRRESPFTRIRCRIFDHCTYLGEIRHKKERHPGQHQP